MGRVGLVGTRVAFEVWGYTLQWKWPDNRYILAADKTLD